MKRFYLITIYLLTTLASTFGQSFIFEHEDQSKNRPLFNNHVASLIRTGQDTMMCFWFSGITEGSEDNRIVYSRSYDNGENWDAPIILLDAPNSDTLYRDPYCFWWSNKLILLFDIQVGGGSSISSKSFQLSYISSEDKGLSWTSPKYIQPSNLPNGTRMVTPFNKPIWINGMPAFGVHWRYTGSAQPHAGLLIADFNTDTFHVRGDVAYQQYLVEPALIQNSDSIIMYFRANRGVVEYVVSKDTGLSWSSPERTKLPNSYSLSSIEQYNGDTLLVVWNNSSTSRDYLSIGLFKGFEFEELIWKEYIDFKPSRFGQVSYPNVLINENSVAIAYSRRTDIGFDTNNKLVAYGDIMLYKTEVGKKANNSIGSIQAKFETKTLLNRILDYDNNWFFVGDGATLGSYNKQNKQTNLIKLPATPYDLKGINYVSKAHEIIAFGNGGWLVRYNLSSNSITHQIRFSDMGSNVNKLCNKDSIKYFVNRSGHIGQFVTLNEPSALLNQSSTCELKDMVLQGDTLYLVGDSLRLSTFSISNGHFENQYVSNSRKYFLGTKFILGRLYAVGEKGEFGYFEGGAYHSIDLGNVLSNFDFHEIEQINDTLILLISNQDVICVYDIMNRRYSSNQLPDNALCSQIIRGGPDSIYLLSKQGYLYLIHLSKLVNNFDSIVLSQKITHSLDYSISIYPNPTNSRVSIESEMGISEVEVFNSFGQLVFSHVNKLVTNQLSIDLSNLKGGLYTIVIQNKNKQMSGIKVIKQE